MIFRTEGDPLGTELDELGPGVLGYAMEIDGQIWIPMIHASSEGSGDVGRFLDSLPKERTIVVPNVVSARLEGMLQRRGYVMTTHELPEEDVDVWTRAAS